MELPVAVDGRGRQRELAAGAGPVPVVVLLRHDDKEVDPVPFRDGGARRVVDVAAPAAAMQAQFGGTLTSDRFALQRVQGVEEVVFQRS